MKYGIRLLNQLRQDLSLWSFLICLFFLFRMALIFYFRDKMDNASGLSDVLSVALQGFRYDAKIVTTFMVFPALFSAASAFFDMEHASNRFRRVWGSFFISVSTIAFVVTIGYFKEYDDQFNHILFNFFYDDTRAIVSTIWSSYHPVLYFFIISLVAVSAMALKNSVVRERIGADDAITAWAHTLMRRIVVVLVVLALFVLGIRGTFGHSRLKRQEAAVTRDEFLNKLVVNPLYALNGAYGDYRDNHRISGVGVFLPDGNVLRAAGNIFSSGAGTLSDIDSYLLKHAAGHRNRAPRHVILIVMESYDAWPLLPQYASLGLTDNLKRISGNGLHFRNFLPSGVQTMPSYSAILTSIPHTSVETNYQITAGKPYPSALAETFRRLGYKTRLFYGGFLGWHRIGEFSRAQGFEEIYGAPHITGASAKNEWGVEDEYLFQFAADKIDDSAPSFNLILSTSNHAPHNVDVERKGFPLTSVPAALASQFDNSVSLHMLGHLWYTDRCVGEFVDRVEGRFKHTLFAFTGDHYGRKFINSKPDSFERSAVPFILYGKEVLAGVAMPAGAAGSHIDIAPTLIELAAPKDFPYYSFGRNLLDPGRRQLGIGWWKIISSDTIADLSIGQIHALPGGALPKKMPEAAELKSLLNDYYGVAWWRVSRGSAVQ